MNVRLSRRARRAVARIDAYWRKKADNPDVFSRELLEAIDFLETVSNAGTPCSTPARPGLKRLLLERSKCHVYFESNEQKQRLEVLTVWDGRRKHGPKL